MFGDFKGLAVDSAEKKKAVEGPVVITGVVVKVDWCEDDCMTVLLKKDDGSMVTIGTKDFGFVVPEKLVGCRVTVEGMDPVNLLKADRKRKSVQKDIQFAASGIKVQM